MFKRIPQQIVPLAALFAVMLTALITARALLIPDTFGDLGHYRAGAIPEIAAQGITYAGAAVCGECHDDVAESKLTSRHSRVPCETCHGPAANHVDEPDEYLPKTPRQRGHCELCHGYNQSRPSGFPQILTERHYPGQTCSECHDPHDPALPHASEDCSACHREIALKKAVSHHVSLDCSRCHNVPKEHLVSPRVARAAVPVSSELCAGCHDSEVGHTKGIPQIDLQSHGDRYRCWDCHYPHYPEAKR